MPPRQPESANEEAELRRATTIQWRRVRKYLDGAKRGRHGAVLKRALELVQKSYKLRREDLPQVLGMSSEDFERFWSKPSVISGGDAINAFRRVDDKFRRPERVRSEPSRAESKPMDGSLTGWVRLDEHRELTPLAEELAEALESFIRTWQRATVRTGVNFPLPEDQRKRLIQDCEAILGILRTGMVETGILRGAAKRSSWVAAAAAVSLAIVSGAAGGVAESAIDIFPDKKKDEAAGIREGAERIERAINRLAARLPAGSSDGVEPGEPQVVQERLNRAQRDLMQSEHDIDRSRTGTSKPRQLRGGELPSKRDVRKR